MNNSNDIQVKVIILTFHKQIKIIIYRFNCGKIKETYEI